MQAVAVAVAFRPTKGRTRRGRLEIFPFDGYWSIRVDPSLDRRILEVTENNKKTTTSARERERKRSIRPVSIADASRHDVII